MSGAAPVTREAPDAGPWSRHELTRARRDAARPPRPAAADRSSRDPRAPRPGSSAPWAGVGDRAPPAAGAGPRRRGREPARTGPGEAHRALAHPGRRGSPTRQSGRRAGGPVRGGRGDAGWCSPRAGHLRSTPGRGGFPGGRLDAGESVVAGALREAAEEVGLDPGAGRGGGPAHTDATRSSSTIMTPVVGTLTGAPGPRRPTPPRSSGSSTSPWPSWPPTASSTRSAGRCRDAMPGGTGPPAGEFPVWFFERRRRDRVGGDRPDPGRAALPGPRGRSRPPSGARAVIAPALRARRCEPGRPGAGGIVGGVGRLSRSGRRWRGAAELRPASRRRPRG